MKLKTFFLFFYLSIALILGSVFYFTFHQYQHYYTKIINERSFAILHSLQNSLIPILKKCDLTTVDNIVKYSTDKREFIKSISISLDNKSILFSSDKSLIGAMIPTGILIENENSITTQIKLKQTVFLYQFSYVDSIGSKQAVIILQLQPSTAGDLLLETIYNDLLAVDVAIFIMIGVMLLIIRNTLIAPMVEFNNLISEKNGSEKKFFFYELSALYKNLLLSYKELNNHKMELQLAWEQDEYLKNILQTIEEINSILISSASKKEIIQKCCDLLAMHGSYILSWIGFVNDENIEITYSSDDPTKYIDENFHISLNPNDQTSLGPTARAIIKNKTEILLTVRQQEFSIWRQKAEIAGIGSSISLPLRDGVNSPPFGVLVVYSSHPVGFLQEEIAMLEELAGNIGFTLASLDKREELERSLTTDHLTGLPNRSSLYKAIEKQPYPKLLVININRFRDINTVYGFDAGDFILRSYAVFLHTLVKTQAVGELFKLAGDEFAVLLNDNCNQSCVQRFSNYIFENTVTQPFFYKDIDIWLSITAGFCDGTDSIIENSEIALRKAKSKKISYIAFDASLRQNKEHEENIYWYKVIKDALNDDRIVPFFHGIVNNTTNKTYKYEALARLIMPDGVIISPFKFLDIAKKTGLYPEITKSIVAKTLQTFKDKDYRVSINLSTEDISNKELLTFLRDSIYASKMGQRVIFEILESEGIENYEEIKAFFDEFRTFGCGFAIDDFGAGFSNFERLLKLQVDYLKIDGSLIKNIQHDKNAQIIVKNIQNFATDLGIATIAEFVSSYEVYEVVRQMGITYSQGFYFHEPVPKII